MRLETLAVRAAGEPDGETGALTPPVHLSTSFLHPADGPVPGGYLYTRYSNPTQDRLESALAALEGGRAALVYGSGMAACAALMAALPPDSHVVLADDTYFSVRTIARDWFDRWRLSYSLVDAGNTDAVRAAIRPQTRCLWLESPSNPRLVVADIAALAELADRAGALLVVDGTFATPVLQRPLALGAHAVVHSLTKYMAGHGDVQAGAVVLARRDTLYSSLLEQRTVMGPVAAPLSSYLVLRGLRTLPCRMAWHCRGARAVAEFLAQHRAIERVHYPGLADHPQHALAARQMSDFGGMVSFEVRGGREPALTAVRRMHLFTSATSLGSTESVVEHRASIEGPSSPTPPGLLRLSVGLEHPDDLVADLDQALSPL